MKRKTHRKNPKMNIPDTWRHRPDTKQSTDLPSNYELTPAQVAGALKAFTEGISKAEEALRRGLELLPQLAGQSRVRLSKNLTKMEAFITEERSSVISETMTLHEDALAHLMHHYCAVDPWFLEQIIEMVPHEAPPVPQLLTPEKLEHYEAIKDITGRFLMARA